METAPFGYYFCGARVRAEPKKKYKRDDTGVNGIIYRACKSDDWNIQQDVNIISGNWGNWYSWVMCDYGEYIKTTTVKHEYRGGSTSNLKGDDDKGVTGLKI